MTDSAETESTDADTEWMVFACTWCDHPLKLRTEQATGMVRCPSCQHEMRAPSANGTGASHRTTLPGLPNGLNSPVFSGELAVDRLSTAQFRSIDDPSLAIPEEGIRVRKRKRRPQHQISEENAPEWEAAEPATAADGGAAALDDWEKISSTTVKQEVRDDGSVIEHRKRTARKRLPPFVEKAWAAFARVGSFSLMALGLFVLIGSAAAGWFLARSQSPVVAQAEKPQEIPDRYFPTMDEGAAAAEVVKAFLAADTVEEKLPLVRFPEKVKPLMDIWYKGRPDKSFKASRDDLAESLTKFLHVDGARFIVVTMLVEPDDEYKLFAVESSPYDGLRVDWETAVGWQAMTVEEFVKGKPTTPQPFRVQAAPGDYYNGAYSDETKWLSVNLTYPGNPDFHLFGYVERNTPAGDQLMRLLGFHGSRTSDGATQWDLVQGQSTALILAIAYLSEGSDPKQVTIHDVLYDQWFLRDGPAVGNARRTGASQ
jgi:DNA-directed RNA polymerase subunit RPC12/RpoP